MTRFDVTEDSIFKFYQKRHNIKSLTKHDLEFLPKVLLMTYGQHYIQDLFCKLPPRLRSDPSLAKYLICKRHLPTDAVADCYLFQKRNCVECRHEENQKMSECPEASRNCQAEIPEQATQDSGHGSC